jgi:hypothetical protein
MGHKRISFAPNTRASLRPCARTEAQRFAFLCGDLRPFAFYRSWSRPPPDGSGVKRGLPKQIAGGLAPHDAAFRAAVRRELKRNGTQITAKNANGPVPRSHAWMGWLTSAQWQQGPGSSSLTVMACLSSSWPGLLSSWPGLSRLSMAARCWKGGPVGHDAPGTESSGSWRAGIIRRH